MPPIYKKKEKGEPVDPRLDELLVDYDEEDNPILVLAYLKKYIKQYIVVQMMSIMRMVVFNI